MSSSHNRTRRAVQSVVAFLPNIIGQCSFPRASWNDGLCKVTADKLPDDVLLDVFGFYLNDNNPHGLGNLKGWHTLVHVCRRWRDIVFASPRGLNLRLLCDRDTPVRAMLDIWPALPIVIHDDWTRSGPLGPDNIIAALKHSDRAIPELTHLDLWWSYGLWPFGIFPPVLPDSFLGGSAPRLRTLKLRDIAFPALRNLLLSACDLVNLSISRLPHVGYISPEAMVACLSSLDRLQTFSFEFPLKSPRSFPDQPRPPPQTLPALTDLTFQGMTDYLDDFLPLIDTPVLNKFSMSFFMDHVFDVPHLMQFIGRAKGLKPYKAARVAFTTLSIQLELTEPLALSLEMMCDTIGLKVHAMSLACDQLSPFLSLVERLDLTADYWPSKSQGEEDHTVSSQFLELFHLFSAIRSLHVSEGLIPFIELALQQLIGERATEVFPNLCDLFMGRPTLLEPVQEAMQPFVTARRLSGKPIVIHHWEGSDADL
ncbi:hypothetical protein BC826DRAFT_1101614 [Russula brevipes]|nr:hypothetical protein BC826DRAFT_1101614 [Russula brevipes]